MELTYDFHIHSCLSPCADDDMTPENIAGMAYLNHLDVAALTDHNSCKNCEAFLSALQQYDILGLCGMELTTSEDVHIICLFPTLEQAMDFDNYVSHHLLTVPNRSSYFGRQLLYAPGDQPDGEYEPLLLCSTDISFSKLDKLMKTFGGIHFPAHIDKSSNSLLSNLGFIPYDSEINYYEMADPKKQEEILSANPRLVKAQMFVDSDAHHLYAIKEGGPVLEAAERSFEAIFPS